MTDESLKDFKNQEYEEGVPEIWVKDLQRREDGVREFLDNVGQIYMHNSREGRDLIRSFWDENEGMFKSLYYGMVENEFFLDDVEESTDEQYRELVETLGKDYSYLENEFHRVFGEKNENYLNWWTNLRTEIDQITFEGYPLTKLQIKSNDMVVTKSRMRTSAFVFAATALVSELKGSLEHHINHENPIPDDEYGFIKQAINDGLADELEEFQELLDKIEEEELLIEGEEEGGEEDDTE